MKNDIKTLTTCKKLAVIYKANNKLKEAKEYFEKCLEGYTAHFNGNEDSEEVLDILEQLIDIILALSLIHI